MCEYGEYRVEAQRYLSEAKRRNKHLKKLKSVSRAYRKSAVRELKARAHAEQVMNQEERVRREHISYIQRLNTQQSMYQGSTPGLDFLGGLFARR